MTRLSNMLGIINSLSKSGFDKCIVPSNKLCVSVLSKIRETNAITGFSHSYSRKRSTFKGHPLTSVHMRLTDHKWPLLKKAKVYKNTSLNILNARSKYLNSQYEGLSTNIISTSPQGLILSKAHEYLNSTLHRRKNSRILLRFDM